MVQVHYRLHAKRRKLQIAKKIINVASLEELEEHVHTEEMMIPADVRIHDQRRKRGRRV